MAEDATSGTVSDVARAEDEFELVLRFRATGDRSLFERLARRHLPLVRRMAAAAFPLEPDLAREAEQESLIRLYRALRSFRGDSALSTFTYGVCVKAHADLRRRLARERSRSERTVSDHGDEAVFSRDASELALRHDAEKAALEALDTLDGKSRTLLYLKEVEGLALTELAGMYDMKEGTVKSLLSRARSKARAYLKERGYETE